MGSGASKQPEPSPASDIKKPTSKSSSEPNKFNFTPSNKNVSNSNNNNSFFPTESNSSNVPAEEKNQTADEKDSKLEPLQECKEETKSEVLQVAEAKESNTVINAPLQIDVSEEKKEQEPIDPSVEYDTNVQPYDENGESANYDPNYPYDPNAEYEQQGEYDPNAAYDPNAPYDPNAAYDTTAATYDENAPYDANNTEFDPNAQYDENATYDANTEYDPNAPYDADAEYDPNAQYDETAYEQQQEQQQQPLEEQYVTEDIIEEVVEDPAVTEERLKQEREVVERQTESENDPLVPWHNFAEVSEFDYDIIKGYVAEAECILQQVCDGDYSSKILMQLPWAYKLNQLRDAIKACYIENGSYLDSSKYDACNDVPRYEQEGMVEWWKDLLLQREEVEKMVNDLESGVDALDAGLEEMREIAEHGNEEEVKKSLQSRKDVLETELTSLRSRCLAVVSIRGGPSRESMEVVYRFLRENVHGDTDLTEIQDEMEEFVSNELEPRHRFLLDVLIRMALLEEELESIDDRLDPTTTTDENTNDNTTNGSTTEEDSSDTKEDNAEETNKNHDEEEEEVKELDQSAQQNQESLVLVEETAASIRALAEEQELEAQKLLQALTAEKEKRRMELMKKFANKRKLLKKGGGVPTDEEGEEGSGGGTGSKITNALTTPPRKVDDKESTSNTNDTSTANNNDYSDIEKMSEQEVITELNNIAVEVEVEVERYRMKAMEEMMATIEAEAVQEIEAGEEGEEDGEGGGVVRKPKLDLSQSMYMNSDVMVNRLEEHERESKRLFDELMAQKERRAAALRARLAALRQGRRSSLTGSFTSTNHETSGKTSDLEDAIEIAKLQAMSTEEIQQEIAAIQSTIGNNVKEFRLKALMAMLDHHHQHTTTTTPTSDTEEHKDTTSEIEQNEYEAMKLQKQLFTKAVRKLSQLQRQLESHQGSNHNDANKDSTEEQTENSLRSEKDPQVGNNNSDIYQMTEQQAITELNKIEEKIEEAVCEYRMEAMTKFMQELESIGGDSGDGDLVSAIEQQEEQASLLMKELTAKHDKRVMALRDWIKKQQLGSGTVTGTTAADKRVVGPSATECNLEEDINLLSDEEILSQLKYVANDVTRLVSEQDQLSTTYRTLMEDTTAEPKDSTGDTDEAARSIANSLKARQCKEQARLAEELLAQREKRAAALREQLQKRRERRGEPPLSESELDTLSKDLGLDKSADSKNSTPTHRRDNEAIESKEEEEERKLEIKVKSLLDVTEDDQQVSNNNGEDEGGDSQASDEEAVNAELEKLDAQIAAAMEEQRMAALNALREKNEIETAKLEQELLAQKEAKTRALKDRLEAKRAARVRELMESRGLSEAAALELACTEQEEEEDKEILKIETEIDAVLVNGRVNAIEEIRCAHERELAKVEQELQTQRDKKMKALNDRLTKRKGQRAMELLETGVTAVEAIDIAETEAAEEEDREKVKIETELTQQLEKQRAELVKPLKELQEKEAKRLEDELLVQETKRRNALQDKLAKKRLLKIANEELYNSESKENSNVEKTEESKAEAISEAKEEEACLEAELIEMKRIHEEVAARLTEDLTLKKKSANSALQDRLNKKKAKKATEKSPEELMEEYLTQLRGEHKVTQDTIKTFIDYEKKVSTAEFEFSYMRPISVGLEDDYDVEDDGGSAALASIAMSYANLKEGLLAGHKLRCIYEIKAIKEKGVGKPLSPEELQAAASTAASQLFKRMARDMKTLLEKRRAERLKMSDKLRADGVSASKLQEALRRLNLRDADAVSREQNKALASLAGLCLDSSLIAPITTNNDTHALTNSDSPLRRKSRVSFYKKSPAVSRRPSADSVAFSDLDDDENHRGKFSPAAREWLLGVLGLLNGYGKCTPVLLSQLRAAVYNIDALSLDDDDGSSNNAYTSSLQAVDGIGALSLRCLAESLFNQLKDSSEVHSFSKAAVEDIVPVIQLTFSFFLSSEAFTSNLPEKSEHKEKIKNIIVASWTSFSLAPHTMAEEPKPSKPIDTEAQSKGTTSKNDEHAEGGGGGAIKADTKRLHDKHHELFNSLELKMNLKKKELDDKLKRHGDGTPGHPTTDIDRVVAEHKEEFQQMQKAIADVKAMVTTRPDLMNEINAATLMAAAEKRAKGEDIGVTDLKSIQEEVNKIEQQKEVRRLLEKQKEEANNLDVALKVKQAREQQALQKRLLQRKSKKQG